MLENIIGGQAVTTNQTNSFKLKMSLYDSCYSPSPISSFFVRCVNPGLRQFQKGSFLSLSTFPYPFSHFRFLPLSKSYASNLYIILHFSHVHRTTKIETGVLITLPAHSEGIDERHIVGATKEEDHRMTLCAMMNRWSN